MDPGQPDHVREQIHSLIDEYFARRQSGEDLSPEQFAADHPEAGEELLPYLEGLAILGKIIPPATGDVTASQTTDAEGAVPLAIPGYELLEEIGRGGMGVVYKARQMSTKRIVALKIMSGGPFASRSARRRFDREVEFGARLQHEGVVRILESSWVAGQRYYAMDFVDGVPLDRYLSARQPGVRVILELFKSICEAVEYAHGHGVIHRDLKPGNVLIDEAGTPHILDFGLARDTDPTDEGSGTGTTSVSVPGQVLGTLFYLSPEQASGDPEGVDVRTDVYALGVMLFESLTGSLPFDTAGRLSEVLRRILEAPATPPRSLSGHVDDEVETITLKALEKDRTRRYQSAGEMAEDIRRYLRGEPILAKRSSSLYFLRKKVLKHRRVAIVAASALLLGMVALAFEIGSRHREFDNARREALRVQGTLEGWSPAAAHRTAKALFAKYPKLPEALLILTHAGYRDEMTRNGAILTLERAQDNDNPLKWPHRMLLAEIYRATGYTERAHELEARARREAPDTVDAWYLRSFATLDRNRALYCAEEVVKRDPSHTPGWRRLTDLRLYTGDLDGALEGADRLIELGEDVKELTFFKGQTLAMQGRFHEAIENYSDVLDDAQPSNSAYQYRAHAYRRIKEYDKAVEDYTRIVERDGVKTDSWTFYQRATPLWILGRTDEALEDYRRVRVQLGFPFYSDARSFLILRGRGRVREAQEVLDAALGEVEDPWLGKIFRCLDGQITADQLVADAAARDNREHLCEAYYYAGETCLLSNRLSEAREWFEKCAASRVEFDLDSQPATPMNEYELAVWRLQSLPAGPTPPPSERN